MAKKFRVNISAERCVDVFVDADSVEEAEAMALSTFREEPEDSYCDGHKGSERVDSCVEVDENYNEV